MKSRFFWFLTIVAFTFTPLGCTQKGYSNKVKVVKPKWRFTLYKPKIDKRKKRVRTVTYRSH